MTQSAGEVKAWKLTDADGRTYGETQWGEGVTHEAPGDGELCTSGWLHYYEDPLLAVLHNPIHGDYATPRLWEAKAEGRVLREGWLKVGCQKLTTLREVPLPEVGTVQSVAYGILCSLEVYPGMKYREWALRWLSGEDRSGAATRAAEAAWAAEAAEAAWAARAAAWAARAAARAAAWAAGAAAAAAWAARAAAWAAAAPLDLPTLARKAMEVK